MRRELVSGMKRFPHLAAGLPWARRMPQATETIHEALILLAGSHGGPRQKPSLTSNQHRFQPDQADPPSQSGQGGPRRLGGLHADHQPAGRSPHQNSSDPATAWLHPTQLRLEGVLGEAGIPEAVDDRYTGDVQIPLRIRTSAPKVTTEFSLRISFQACTDSECLPPEERVVTAKVLIEG